MISNRGNVKLVDSRALLPRLLPPIRGRAMAGAAAVVAAVVAAGQVEVRVDSMRRRGRFAGGSASSVERLSQLCSHLLHLLMRSAHETFGLVRRVVRVAFFAGSWPPSVLPTLYIGRRSSRPQRLFFPLFFDLSGAAVRFCPEREHRTY